MESRKRFRAQSYLIRSTNYQNNCSDSSRREELQQWCDWLKMIEENDKQNKVGEDKQNKFLEVEKI